MGVKGLSFKTCHGCPPGLAEQGSLGLESASVGRVAKHRVADMGEVHADLMRAPGLEPAGEQAHRRRSVPARIGILDVPVRYRRAAVRAHRHAFSRAPLPSEWGI